MNRRKHAVLVLTVVLAALHGAAANSEPAMSDLMPTDIQWKDSPLPGVQTVIISGSPASTGLYIIRAKLAPDAKVAPHTHPDTRYDTVLSGEIFFGFGETFDAAKGKRYPAGAHITVPANMPHFAWVKEGEAVLQEVGIGPSGHNPVKK